jgi:hypothetical protein
MEKKLVTTAKFKTELEMIEGLSKSDDLLKKYCTANKSFDYEIIPEFKEKKYSIYMSHGDTERNSDNN